MTRATHSVAVLVGAILTYAQLFFPVGGFAAEATYEFRFNEGAGTLADSSGSVTGQAELRDNQQSGVSLFSKSGEGVSGQPGDYAFDNRTAVGMGDTPGGCAVFEDAGATIDEAVSFTITGWFKTPPGQVLTNNAVLLNLSSDDKSRGIILRGWNPPETALQVRVNGERILTSPMNAFPESDEWVFFAVTCDLTQSAAQNTLLYAGGVDRAVHDMAAGRMEMDRVEGGNLAASIGAANSQGGKPFLGLIDNIRVYVSKQDGGASLSLDELEILRQRDVQAP